MRYENDRRNQFPKATRLAEWALSKAEWTVDDIDEYDGKKYRTQIRNFRCNIGKRISEVRKELKSIGKPVYLIEDGNARELHITVGGKYQSDYGNLFVSEAIYTLID